MMACRSWNRMDCARALSSDMWLTPKNWLSPKSTRSITWSRVCMPPASCDQPNMRDQKPLARRRDLGRGMCPAAVLGQDHGDQAIGLQGRAERVDVVGAPAFYGFHEVVDLRRVLLAAQVVPDLLSQIGRVLHRPARLELWRGRVRSTQVDLALLPIGGDPTVGAPHRDFRGHLAKALVAPVDGQLSGGAVRVVQRAVDLVLDVPRMDAPERDTANRRWCPDHEVHQVERVTRVVVERAATLVLGRSPGAALRPQHHRPVGFGAHVVDLPQRGRPARCARPPGTRRRSDSDSRPGSPGAWSRPMPPVARRRRRPARTASRRTHASRARVPSRPSWHAAWRASQ